jgi:hypothetical protein
MPTKGLKELALAQLLGLGCAVALLGASALELAQAQPQFVPPAPPPPPPVFNPPSPNRTVPQPSYTPLAPATPSAGPGSEVTSPVNAERPRTTARSKRRISVAKTRPVHHHRGRIAGATLGSHYCGYSPCVRIHPSAFYGYAAPASGLWWPGYYDYAPGQFGRGRPRYFGYWRRSGYHGD